MKPEMLTCDPTEYRSHGAPPLKEARHGRAATLGIKVTEPQGLRPAAFISGADAGGIQFGTGVRFGQGVRFNAQHSHFSTFNTGSASIVDCEKAMELAETLYIAMSRQVVGRVKPCHGGGDLDLHPTSYGLGWYEVLSKISQLGAEAGFPPAVTANARGAGRAIGARGIMALPELGDATDGDLTIFWRTSAGEASLSFERDGSVTGYAYLYGAPAHWELEEAVYNPHHIEPLIAVLAKF